MHHGSRPCPAIVLVALISAGWSGLAHAEAGKVDGWFKAGTDPGGYEIGTVDTDQGRVAYIRSLDPDPTKFGTLMQSFAATEYRGERIRLRARVRTQDVQNWVGMWMRVDAGKKTAAFDNMEDRALRGTTGWQEYSIVLDVPDAADTIAMGIILAGDGRAEWGAIGFETVSDDVPLTCMIDRKDRKGPANLDFEQ